MPVCKICNTRIELSRTGVRAYKCRICGRIVCYDHYDLVRSLCYVCARIPIKRPTFV
ncbi:MAG: hypothetical protein QXK12_07015 [Candidatus Nezhaarchaeales archaeon]